MASRPASSSTRSDTIFLALLGGAAIGAVVTALITPKTGREVCGTLRTAARRLCGKADGAEDDGPIEALFI